MDMPNVSGGLTWTQIKAGEYETQGQHAYYRIHHNLTTGMWHVGRRQVPGTPIVVVHLGNTLKAAKDYVEHREAAL